MAHIVLLGDSIFDNKSYVGKNGTDVITHLKSFLPEDWRATLRAVDGNTTEGIGAQLRNVPGDATHLVMSIGGNDAIMRSDILQMRADSSAEVLNEIANVQNDFENRYKQALNAVLAKNLPTAVCTIYNPRFPDAAIQKIAVAALCVFNDAIIRLATQAGVPLLDLRLICDKDSDYANPIEPSDKGGKKIAAKILELIKTHDFSRRRTEIFA